MTAQRCVNRSLACLVVITVLVCGTAVAETASELRFDPFRPLPNSADNRSQNSSRNAPAAFYPSLRSTVVAGEKSLANLGGEIIGLEEEKKGYRLLEVRPFEAVFDKEGQEIRIQVERFEGEGQ